MQHFVTPFDREKEQLLVYAVRYVRDYSGERKPKNLNETVNYLISILPQLSSSCLFTLSNDMIILSKKDDDSIWGPPCDRAQWKRFWSAILAERKKRYTIAE